MKKIFGVLVGVIMAFVCDAGSLCLICIGNRPYESEVYESGNGAGVYVVQVLENGVLASVRPGSLGCVAPNFIFVEMSTAGIVDGESLPWDGMYKLNGTFHYISTVGSEKTVYKFRECTKKERADYLDYLKREKERQQKYDEEQKKLQEEKHMAEMMEIRLNAMSNVVAMVSQIDLDFGNRFYIEKKRVKTFEFKVKHYLWQRLLDSKNAGNVHEFLNVALAIVNNEDKIPDKFKDGVIKVKKESSSRRRRRDNIEEFSTDYEEDAYQVLNQLKEYQFRVGLWINGKEMPSGLEGLRFVAFGVKEGWWNNGRLRYREQFDYDDILIYTYGGLFSLDMGTIWIAIKNGDSESSRNDIIEAANIEAADFDAANALLKKRIRNEISKKDFFDAIIKIDKKIREQLGRRFKPCDEFVHRCIEHSVVESHGVQSLETAKNANEVSVKTKIAVTPKCSICRDSGFVNKDLVCERCGGVGECLKLKGNVRRVEKCKMCNGTGMIKDKVKCGCRKKVVR